MPHFQIEILSNKIGKIKDGKEHKINLKKEQIEKNETGIV